MSKVSIIMPAYNAGKFIGQAIRSILAQTHKDWELLILDDASTDDTFQMASSFEDPRISIFQHSENKGYLKSCNFLFENANGHYLTFLDADDTCSPNRFEVCVSTLKKQQIDFLTTDFSKIREGQKPEEIQTEVKFDKVRTDPNYYPTICCATIFVKIELARSVGGYHPIFDRMGAEDYHWLFRLASTGKGVHLHKNLYQYRQHKDQIRGTCDPGHFIAHDLDLAIRKTFIETDVDLLSESNSVRLEKLRSDLLIPFEKNSTLILRYKCIQELNAGEWRKAVSTMLSAISASPFDGQNWQRLFYVLYVMSRRASQI